ncbi:hypothetical protein [Calidithermus roseus]|uniref:Uncharacterized protein n=1 Tax=Calidithermus roseus TaxID=1644118 RepID=A0A399EYK6_9DEIN|nr:hypothetical protein [Calidithermus roseus]RIH88685.1 hypothetical protein Mrose_00718 [Calidithermus roseus]
MQGEIVDIQSVEGMDRVFEEISRAIESVPWIRRSTCGLGALSDYRYTRCYSMEESYGLYELNSELIPSMQARGIQVNDFEVGDETQTSATLAQYPNIWFHMVYRGGGIIVDLYLRKIGAWRSPEMPKGTYALVDLGTAARDAAWSLLYRAGYSPSRLRKAEQACTQTLQPHQYCLELDMSSREFARVVSDVYFDGPEDMFWRLYNARKSFRYAGEFAVRPPGWKRRERPLYAIEYKPGALRESYVIEDNLAYKFMRFAISYTPHGEGGTLLVSASMR